MRSDVEREIEADARSLAESVYPAYDPDADDAPVEGPGRAWIELDDEDGRVKLYTELWPDGDSDWTYVSPDDLPPHLYEKFEVELSYFEDGCGHEESALDAYSGRFGGFR